jgi:hypothetical protein
MCADYCSIPVKGAAGFPAFWPEEQSVLVGIAVGGIARLMRNCGPFPVVEGILHLLYPPGGAVAFQMSRRSATVAEDEMMIHKK